jgi:hypothetical protein
MNICAKCIHHREVTDSEGREMWGCEAPHKETVCSVTGEPYSTKILCMIKNPHGNCGDFKEGQPPVVKKYEVSIWTLIVLGLSITWVIIAYIAIFQELLP